LEPRIDSDAVVWDARSARPCRITEDAEVGVARVRHILDMREKQQPAVHSVIRVQPQHRIAGKRHEQVRLVATVVLAAQPLDFAADPQAIG